MGDNDLHGLIWEPEPPYCGQIIPQRPISRWIGGLGHEHPPGCPGPTCDTDALLWLGFLIYPDTYLRQEDKDILNSSGFLVPFGENPKGFFLWDADKDEKLDRISEGQVFCKESYEFSISADPGVDSPKVQSAKLTMTGPISVTNTENEEPYVVFDDSNGNIHGRDWKVGSYEIKAKFFSKNNRRGDVVDEISVAFEVEKCD